MENNYDQYVLSTKELIRFIVVGYVVGLFVFYLFYRNIVFSMVGGLLVIFFIPNYKEHLAEKRKKLLQLQFKDFLISMSASVAAGRQINVALIEANDSLHMLYEEDSPLCKELQSIVECINNSRGNAGDLLVDFAKRSSLEDIINFANTYNLCIRLGGNIEETITRTKDIIMDKISIMKEIETITAQKKFEGRIITAMPIVVIAGLNVFYPEYLSVMYTTLAGRIVMTLALGGMILSYLLTQKMMNFEV